MQGDHDSFHTSISDDGRYVTISERPTRWRGEQQQQPQRLPCDLLTGEIQVVGRSQTLIEPPWRRGEISGDGRGWCTATPAWTVGARRQQFSIAVDGSAQPAGVHRRPGGHPRPVQSRDGQRIADGVQPLRTAPVAPPSRFGVYLFDRTVWEPGDLLPRHPGPHFPGEVPPDPGAAAPRICAQRGRAPTSPPGDGRFVVWLPERHEPEAVGLTLQPRNVPSYRRRRRGLPYRSGDRRHRPGQPHGRERPRHRLNSFGTARPVPSRPSTPPVHIVYRLTDGSDRIRGSLIATAASWERSGAVVERRLSVLSAPDPPSTQSNNVETPVLAEFRAVHLLDDGNQMTFPHRLPGITSSSMTTHRAPTAA